MRLGIIKYHTETHCLFFYSNKHAVFPSHGINSDIKLWYYVIVFMVWISNNLNTLSLIVGLTGSKKDQCHTTFRQGKGVKILYRTKTTSAFLLSKIFYTLSPAADIHVTLSQVASISLCVALHCTRLHFDRDINQVNLTHIYIIE